ncbi:hypothetical protein A9Q81_21020 [Gammaproteobacteria bacterium 42_54_T18]|nr:hypothetical protein A9Q81_21020 [Gammaproteobacteria bacterium 42_54_T18]
MSFELLDFINKLIAEETQELPPKQLVVETDSKYLPSDERVVRFHSITHNTIATHRQARLSEARAKYEAHRQKESLYNRAVREVPNSVEQIFHQIVGVITSGGDTVPKGWTLAHRGEEPGKDNDEELKKIWMRMYMLGFIDHKSKGKS